MLEKLGIEYRTGFAAAGFKCNRNRAPVFIIRIDRIKSIDKWFNEVGTHNPRHQTRYDVWKKLGFLPPKTTINERRELLIKNMNL